MLSTTRTRATAHHHRAAGPRAVAWPVAVLLAVGLAACGDDGAEDLDLAADDGSDLPGLEANGMLGLEVVTAGDVSEVLDSNAFRMDKDGLGPRPESEEPVEVDPESPDPLDYYDTDALTAGDDELGYGTDQEGVLVIVPDGDLELRSGDPVRVSGTVRALDAEGIEEVYGVAIDADVYAPYEDQLVIIARQVGLPGS